MILQDPVVITSRLKPGVMIGGTEISIDWSGRPGNRGRLRAEYWIDIGEQSYHNDDLQTGCGGGSLRELLGNLLSFLSARGESVNHGTRTGRQGENADLFPEFVGKWAAANEDALGCAQCEIEENPDCLKE